MAERRSTWNRRERPILEALFELEEEGQKRVWSGLIAERTGLAEPEVVRGLGALAEAGYYRAGATLGGYDRTVLVAPQLREKARREIGQWPADSFDAFVAVLQERIRVEQEPEVRSRLQRLLDAVLSVGRDVAADVIGAAIKQAGGL